MTAPEQDSGKLTATKALFIGLFAAALGWAGVLVAAFAVGTEQAWSGGATERARAGERTGSWLDEQRAWLGADHQARQARAAANKSWLDSGGDPAARPAGPSRGQKAGRAARRLFANAVLGFADFARGARQGWNAADQVRRMGGTFPDVASARPQHVWSCPGCGLGMSAPHSMPPTADTRRCPTCRGKRTEADPPNDPPSPAIPASPDDLPWRDQPLVTADDLDDLICHDDPPEPVTPRTYPSGDDQPDNPGPTAPATTGNPASEGAPMTQPAESNATVLAAKLTTINATVGEMVDDVDALNAFSATLHQKVQAATDLAETAGMPTETRTAADTARQAATAAKAHLDDFVTATDAATEQLTAATQGLSPVHAAEDNLHSVGADGRALDTTHA